MTLEEKKEKSRLYDKEYRKNNKEKISNTKKAWVKNNPDKVVESLKRNKEGKKIRDKKYASKNKEKLNIIKKRWAKNNPDKIKKSNAKYIKRKLSSDYLFKLKRIMGNIIRYSLKNHGYIKKNRSQEIIGCTYQELKNYIESKFEPWMSWDNYGKYNGELNYGWDIDHIIPISSSLCEDDIVKLNHYTNLQPLCSYCNRYIKRNII